MIKGLKLLNLSVHVPLSMELREEKEIEEIEAIYTHDFFYLKTCQRKLLLTLNNFPDDLVNSIEGPSSLFLQDEEAYSFALGVLVGLKSYLLTENEIVQQFKESLTRYLKSKRRDPKLIKILEKLLHDNKAIRSKYFVGVPTQSYAKMTKDLIVKHLNDHNNSSNILIIGLGNLARDLIKELSANEETKETKITLAARDASKVNEFCNHHHNNSGNQISSIPWNSFDKYHKFEIIVCCIGINAVLLDEDFFTLWNTKSHNKKLFIDLGWPSSIHTPLKCADGVYRLENVIFENSTFGPQHKLKILNAQKAISEIAQKRMKFIPPLNPHNPHNQIKLKIDEYEQQSNHI
ncbi:MAG: hypothetical protein HQK49_03370 [Oligoflexia bacterium]|nr:hypothetical protein [Oligoflexia bacterium]